MHIGSYKGDLKKITKIKNCQEFPFIALFLKPRKLTFGDFEDGIVFTSSIHWYYIRCSKMYITQNK